MLHSVDFKATPMMLAGVNGAQSNLNLAVGGNSNTLSIGQKDLKMAYVPKRKN